MANSDTLTAGAAAAATRTLLDAGGPAAVPSAVTASPAPTAAVAKPQSRGWLWTSALVVLAAGLVLLGGKGGLISNFTYLQLSLVLVYAIAVLGLNLLTGFNGQISLGHGAFFAVGAYTAAILIERYDVNYLITLPVAAIVCFVAGYLFGLPALRLEGHYLALATFALATAVPQILKYRHIEGLTGGVQGINLIKPDAPFKLPLSGDQWMYIVVLATTVLMFWIARNLLGSRVGRAMMAIRDQPLAATAMGINIAQTKAITFGISALYVGVAGALHAIIFEFIAPDSFRFDLSVAFLVGAVIGGIASLPGALIGGIFVQVIDKYADSLTKTLTSVVHLPLELEPWTIYGILLIALMYVMPGGIAYGLYQLHMRWKLRRQ
jgi:branched-chain amino acid transport system permease protein